MLTRRTLRYLLVVLVGLALLPGAQAPSPVAADTPAYATPDLIITASNQLGIVFVRSGISGIQAAILTATFEQCATNSVAGDKVQPPSKERIKKAGTICLQALAKANPDVAAVVNALTDDAGSGSLIQGTWISNFGPAVIYRQYRMVVTFAPGRGTGTADIQLSVAVAEENLFSFTYQSYYNNDNGVGVLILSADGCAMYGRYVSRKDPTNTGQFNMIRCNWDGNA